MTEEKNEVAVVENDNAIATSIMREAGARAEMMSTMTKSLVKACHQRNILDMGGNPFIDDDGCQKIARVAGISFSTPMVESRYEDGEDGQQEYVVEVSGEASILGQSLFDIGACTSADGFISKRSNISHQQMKIEVKKKAYANWRGRCVRALLGLKELTWTELESAGFSKDGASKVEYKKGKSSGKSEDGDDTRKKLGDMILNAVDGNKTAAGDVLFFLTNSDKYKGKNSVSDLTDKQAGFIYGQHKEGGKKRADFEDAVIRVCDEYGIGKASE
jgi:hypothetical protein